MGAIWRTGSSQPLAAPNTSEKGVATRAAAERVTRQHNPQTSSLRDTQLLAGFKWAALSGRRSADGTQLTSSLAL